MRGLSIGWWPDPELGHQRRERHAAESCQAREAFEPLRLELLHLGDKTQQLGMLVRCEGLALAFFVKLCQAIPQLRRQAPIDVNEQRGLLRRQARSSTARLKGEHLGYEAIELGCAELVHG